MKLLSWNVNGLRAVHDKDLFLPFLAEHAPDVLLLQETKAWLEHLPGPLQDVNGYLLKMHSASRKGYSGVGIYTREEPDEWFEGMGTQKYDDEGRVLGARFGDVVAISVYFPNSQAAGARLDYRLNFGAALLRFLTKLRDDGYHVVLAGDYNVAHHPVDLARPKANESNPGYLPEERAWMDKFLGRGYVDSWRRANPEEVGYSWWSYRFQARKKNIGWRLDYCCVDEELWPRISAPCILSDVHGSDHCPVGLSWD